MMAFREQQTMICFHSTAYQKQKDEGTTSLKISGTTFSVITMMPLSVSVPNIDTADRCLVSTGQRHG